MTDQELATRINLLRTMNRRTLTAKAETATHLAPRSAVPAAR